MSSKPTFFVGKLPIYGDTILAPMAGFSDVPYRALCRAYGSAMNYTEFVPVEAFLGKRRDNKFWRRLDKKKGEYPVVFQIFGNDALKILNAAKRIEQLEPDIIDINMGCSTRKVSGRGAGVGMMPQPELVAETFRLLSQNLTVPVSGKIRLGWDTTQQNYLEIARIMQDNGAALVAMHARTKSQKYNGRADWDAIALLRQTIDIPVIGNGDIQSPSDIDRMKSYTGCEAVMIGRAAIGNPWIFNRSAREDLSIEEIIAAVRLHVLEMVDYYGEKSGMLLFRKHLKKYLEDVPEAKYHIQDLLQISELNRFFISLHEIESANQMSFVARF